MGSAARGLPPGEVTAAAKMTTQAASLAPRRRESGNRPRLRITDGS